jgi:aerobic-type carbon monoxide dehydrogenase small subunit (CoxS/CutS family)
MHDPQAIVVHVNDRRVEAVVDARVNLADFLRDQLRMTGTHVGCEHGVCGACTVLVDGASMRSCLTLAVQVNSRHVETVEGLAKESNLHPLQKALSKHHGLQCGFCTPGVLMTLVELSREVVAGQGVTEDEVRKALSGNLCRCTGYQGMVHAALDVLNNQQQSE